MTQKEIIKHMRNILDWQAKEYGKYSDEEVLKDIKKEFKIEARNYNTLLKHMYPSIKYDKMFPLIIGNYINIRECENWE